MSTVIVVTAILMAAGGVISYLGDRWGYALGKKRLSLFGMRPRKTASFLTVVAGVMIALVTFAVLLGVSAGFRFALTRGAALLHTNHVLKYENRDLAGKNLSLQQEADRDQAQTQSEAVQERQAQAALVKTKVDLTQRQAQLQAVGLQLAAARAGLQVAQAHLQVANSRLQATQRRYAIAEKNLNSAIAGAAARTRNALIYSDGAEVGRQVIRATQSDAAIQRDIVYFLNDLSSRAEQRGALVGSNSRAVVIASIRLGVTSTFVGEGDSIQALADRIHARGAGSVVVVAKALGNAFANKPVVILLRPYADRLVIPAGSVLRETIIPQQEKGVAEILGDIEAFLKGPVRDAAIDRGVIPVVIDPTTHQETTEVIDAQEIDSIVGQIQHIQGDTVLVATAAKDTWAADQVSIQLSVHPASGQTVAAPTSGL